MIDANIFMKGKRKPKVGFPRDLKPEFTPLYGYFNKESNYYNVIPSDAPVEDMGGVAPVLLGHFYQGILFVFFRNIYGIFTN